MGGQEIANNGRTTGAIDEAHLDDARAEAVEQIRRLARLSEISAELGSIRSTKAAMSQTLGAVQPFLFSEKVFKLTKEATEILKAGIGDAFDETVTKATRRVLMEGGASPNAAFKAVDGCQDASSASLPSGARATRREAAAHRRALELRLSVVEGSLKSNAEVAAAIAALVATSDGQKRRHAEQLATIAANVRQQVVAVQVELQRLLAAMVAR